MAKYGANPLSDRSERVRRVSRESLLVRYALELGSGRFLWVVILCAKTRGFLAKDWKKKGHNSKPKFVHMGDNHPYPNAPKQACQEYAEEIGFESGDSIISINGKKPRDLIDYQILISDEVLDLSLIHI